MRDQGYNGDGEVMSSSFVNHEPVDTDTPGPSLTRQEFADECDINSIMARYETNGLLPSHVNPVSGQYLDLSDVPDLRSAIDLMRNAEAAFMRLPASARREFDNDPVKFVEFAQSDNEENHAKMREWGLMEPLPKEPEIPVVRVEGFNPEPTSDKK